MINFLRHLGWITVPRYVVKCYSGCFWEGAFGSLNFVCSRLSFIVRVGLILSVEGFNRTKRSVISIIFFWFQISASDLKIVKEALLI